MFTKSEENQIKAKGLTTRQVYDQIETIHKGIDSIRLVRPATPGDGILQFSEVEEKQLIKNYEDYEGVVMKFVPASGAATRMFKHLFAFREEMCNDFAHQKLPEIKREIQEFFHHIQEFAFYPELKKAYERLSGRSMVRVQTSQDYWEVLNALLENRGLNYGHLPKGLLTFHRYEKESRTAAHEQLSEGLGYAVNSGKLLVHFTVSPEHLPLFEHHLYSVSGRLGGRARIEMTYSTQKPDTDTISINAHNEPFRDGEGKLLFRPAGHGALLENLNDLDAEMVFIKNIDNVVPDRLKATTIKYKKLLAGTLLYYQHKITALLKRNEKGENITNDGNRLLGELGLKGVLNASKVVEHLNRPVRVCGVVSNTGEPGGGPFWVHSANGSVALQIVESAQVNRTDKGQGDIFRRSTHFNPVDMVCGPRNFRGEKFNLLKYRDEKTGLIVEKSHAGRKIRALELPGLWNGGMAHWNTVFVEVPLTTFSPVKTINDLLRETHSVSQAARPITT